MSPEPQANASRPTGADRFRIASELLMLAALVAILSLGLLSALLAGLLIWICWLKGEKPRWRWGGEE